MLKKGSEEEMISEEKLSEIERLEAEQMQIKAKIKALKEDSRLQFGEVNGHEYLYTAIRKVVLEIARKPHQYNVNGRIYVHMTSCKKISELSQEQIKNMNAFISEISPIVNKYIELNASLFEKKGSEK